MKLEKPKRLADMQETPITDRAKWSIIDPPEESDVVYAEIAADLERKLALAVHALKQIEELENPEGWAASEQTARFYLIELGLIERGEDDVTEADLEEWGMTP